MAPVHRTRLCPLLLAVAALGAGACTGTTKIDELLSNPDRYDGEEVKVRGTVRNTVSIPFLEVRIYNVQDNTGEVVVLTSGALPNRGDKITVHGTFSTLGSVNGRSFGPHIKVAE